MLSLAGARGYVYVLEFGWAAGVCNRMLTLALSLSAAIDSCFGHLGLLTEPFVYLNTATKCYSVFVSSTLGTVDIWYKCILHLPPFEK